MRRLWRGLRLRCSSEAFRRTPLSPIQSPYCGDGVPVVGRNNRHRVDFLDREQLAEITEGLRLVTLLPFDQCDGAIEMASVDVANGSDADIGLLHEFFQTACALVAHS